MTLLDVLIERLTLKSEALAPELRPCEITLTQRSPRQLDASRRTQRGCDLTLLPRRRRIRSFLAWQPSAKRFWKKLATERLFLLF